MWATSLLVCSNSVAAQSDTKPDQIAFFETKIRPVLAKTCYRCHSHRAKNLKAGLHLDSRAAMLEGGDNGSVIVPGDSSKSRLIAAIGYLDNDLQMPPKKKLPAAVVVDFEKWIKMGAPWPKETATLAKDAEPEASKDWGKLREAHWAYRLIANPEIPQVTRQDRVNNPIDAFVLARLEEAGLEPNPPAPKRILIRRAYIDLIGVPPTPAEVEAFVEDESPEAYGKIVDTLLASPHYGERWARHWLDVARYSDGVGGFLDRAALPHAWRYRDWVIEALNKDLPYDQFVTQQLAGDLMGDPSLRVAGGFLAVGPTYTADGGDPKAVAEAKSETLNDRVDTVTRSFLALTVACARCHDHKFDPIPTADYYSLSGIFQNTRLTNQTIASKKAVDAFNKGMAPLRAAEAGLKTFIKEETKAYQDQVLLQDLPEYMLAAVSLSHLRIANKRQDIRAFATEHKLSHHILGRFLQWFTNKGSRKRWKEFQSYFDWIDAHSNDYFLDEELCATVAAIQKDVNVIIKASGKSTGKAKQAFNRMNRDLRNHCAPNFNQSNMVELGSAKQAQMKAMRDAVADAKKTKPKPLPEAHFLADTGSRDMAISIRGNIRKPGKVVPRRFLHIVAGEEAPHFKKGSGRMQLAAAIVHKDNPLTARVMINRIWQHHFGRAIVRTPSNFGVLGEKPTHPKLLDYLATKFIAEGWSMKAMHRLIMLSSTYQTSSDYDEQHFLQDGDNRFNWRMNPRKMAAESWRDSLLAVTGELSSDFGGQPAAGIFQTNRRTIYAKVSRNGDKYDSDRFLRLFDFPDPRSTSAGRSRSIVPQQYLFMLNSPFMISRGKALASRLTREAKDDAARIDRAYALLFSRKPTPREKQAGLDFLAVKASGRPILERYLQALLSTHEFMQIQ